MTRTFSLTWISTIMKNEKMYIYGEDWMHELIVEEILNKYCVQTNDWLFSKKFDFRIAKNNGDVIMYCFNGKWNNE